MTRRCLVWILCGLLLTIFLLGILACKEDEGTVQQETTAEEGQTTSGTTMSDTTGLQDETGDFEEEEGVEQESPPQYDY